MKCTAEGCGIKPELRDSGWSDPHPAKYCPVCKAGYWRHVDGKTNPYGKVTNYSETFNPYPQSGSAKEYYDKYQYEWMRPTF